LANTTKISTKQVNLFNKLKNNNAIEAYQGVEAGTEIMRGDEDMIRTTGAIPKRKLGGNEFDGRGNEASSMSNRREPINSAEIARNIHGHEEKIGLKRVKSAESALYQSSMNRHLRSEQVFGASLVLQPIGVEFRGQIVDVDLQPVERGGIAPRVLDNGRR